MEKNELYDRLYNLMVECCIPEEKFLNNIFDYFSVDDLRGFVEHMEEEYEWDQDLE